MRRGAELFLTVMSVLILLFASSLRRAQSGGAKLALRYPAPSPLLHVPGRSESRRSFDTVSQLINPGDPIGSMLL
jgi:hypothetical protein